MMSLTLEQFFDTPRVCRMSRRLTQAEIDGDGIVWVRFPKCDKCNPNGKCILVSVEGSN